MEIANSVTFDESIAVQGSASINSALSVGLVSAVGGGVSNISGSLGLSRVFDGIYNRPSPGEEVPAQTYGPTGTLLSSLTYAPAFSGLYTLTMEITVDSAGLAWTNGVNLIVGYIGSPFPPFSVLSDSYLACDSVANPAGFPFPIGGDPIVGIYKKDIVAVVNLVPGTSYAPQARFSAGTNLGATGGVQFFIQPVIG